MTIERAEAIDLLRELVAIPSPSGEETAASGFLVERMRALGFDRAEVDEVGNALGEMGPVKSQRVIVLLGHIDTVPGEIPVRIETVARRAAPPRELLFGRGSVDAKGPLAAMVAAVARLGSRRLIDAGMRIVVAGAVEEESATSRGARHLRDRFDGRGEPVPAACVIGEPSGVERVTLGYKGRLLIDLEARRQARHTAGPDAGVAVTAVDLWQFLSHHAAELNQAVSRPFDQLQPSLRAISTDYQGGLEEQVTATYAVRLPEGFDHLEFMKLVVGWAENHSVARSRLPAGKEYYRFAGKDLDLRLRFHGYEPACRSSRHTPLVRAFLGAIRAAGPADVRPGFVVKTGTSDMNVVGPAWGCPILAYGPGDSALDHTPNEHLPLDDYWLAVQILERALRALIEDLVPERS